MLIDLKKYFSGEDIAQQIDYTIDMSEVEVDGYYPFITPVRIVGDIRAFASSAELNVTVSYAFSMPCRRRRDMDVRRASLECVSAATALAGSRRRSISF